MYMQTNGLPKILIIDDDRASSALVKNILQVHDFLTVVLNDSTRALKVVEEEHPDLILLDLIMPDVCGTDVLEYLRQKFSPVDLPIVMLTAMHDSSNIAYCLKLGANDYLAKPIDPVIAVARVSTQLELVRLYRENLRKKEIETLHAMVVTYNHEINNPLTAAMLSLPSDVKDVSQEKLDEVRADLQRIANIVSKIEHVTQNAIRTEQYSKGAEIIQL